MALTITGFRKDSPADHVGLHAGDEVVALRMKKRPTQAGSPVFLRG